MQCTPPPAQLIVAAGTPTTVRPGGTTIFTGSSFEMSAGAMSGRSRIEPQSLAVDRRSLALMMPT